MKRKWACIISFILMSLYAPAELTRYIIAYQKFYGAETKFTIEIFCIWFCYVIMMILFNKILWTKWEDK